MDKPSSQFALEFYRKLVAGYPVGEAICQARKSLVRQYAEETIVWASCVLYGDPTHDYMDQIRSKEFSEEPGAEEILPPAEPVRTREEVIDFSEKESKKSSPARWLVAAILAVVIVVLLWGYPGYLRTSPAENEKAAFARYHEGNYQEAFEISQDLVNKYPQRVASHVILGNIYFSNGDKEKAHQHYQLAMAAEAGQQSQKAQAMIGLGRLASFGNQPDATRP